MESPIYPDLKGKHVLITGGAAGIGEGIALAFAGQGARVTILDRDEEGGARVAAAVAAAGGQGASYVVDLTDSPALVATLARVKEEVGPVEVLVNNAGFDPRYDVLEMSDQEWDDLFALNVRHYFVAAREVLPDMIAAGKGSIIMTSSHLVWIAKPDLVCYNATKAAIVGMVRTLARAVGKHGIRVNSVAPGWVFTERQMRMWATPEAKDHTVNELQSYPIALMPEDLAQAFLFLASDASRSITRQTLVCDGGFAQT